MQYPPEVAPRFLEGGRVHRVVDCSEGGFRYVPADAVLPAIGSMVSGVLEFRDETTLEVAGAVVRIQAGEVAVHCAERPIPLGVVMREQRLLLARYPFRGTS